MLRFVRREADILVATTIIESGLDIPNANTIFINQADNYGLADLHQLRGRVGRYKHRAYAYMLLDGDRQVTPTAARRLKAIEEFTELGAGFKIAMRDLEIRGAGNILGTQQSGHIAAVGYEMYCQLLENAVRDLKRQPLRTPLDVTVDLPWTAYLPRDYVAGQRQRIEVYRRLARVRGWTGWRISARSCATATAPCRSRPNGCCAWRNCGCWRRTGRSARCIWRRRRRRGADGCGAGLSQRQTDTRVGGAE